MCNFAHMLCTYTSILSYFQTRKSGKGYLECSLKKMPFLITIHIKKSSKTVCGTGHVSSSPGQVLWAHTSNWAGIQILILYGCSEY